MTKALSRRQFLKATAAGGATAAFAPLFGLNARPVTAKPSVPERVLHAAATTSASPFTALPSTLPLNAPLADISMGSDGTLWAIDSNGVPYSYDQMSQTWDIYTDQIDAITTVSRWQGTSAPNNAKFTQPLVVMGNEITSPIDGTPMQLQDAFANLPTSFQLGLDGIAEVNGKLYLFRHGRYNVPANRSISSVAPLGLSFSTSGYASHTPGEAADLIDAMQGQQVTDGLLGGVLSKLKSAWKEIKATAAKVTQAVVSIADEVYVGITYVVDGITKVVKDLAHDVEDALAAIGSFFVQLSKDLLKAVEALSLLLHLGEIVKTSKIINDQINGVLSDLKITLTTAKTDFDQFFNDADNKVTEGFCHLFDILKLPEAPGCGTSAAQLGTSSATPLTGLNGVGATPTTVYNTGQSGGSQAVQCGWSSHSLRTHIKGGSETSTLQLAQTNDPFLALLETFFNNLATDSNLKQAYSDVGNTFSATFKVTSPKEFLAMAVEDLLELLKAILITGVAIVQSLVDTLLGAIDTLVQQMQNLGNVKIPIFSALWKKLTGNELTFLDLLSLVLAFPVTFIYRAATGFYPSASTSMTSMGGGAEFAQVDVAITPGTEKMIIDVMGLVGTCSYMIGADLTGFLDALYITEGPLAVRDYGLGWIEKLSGLCTLLQIVGTFGFSQTDPSDTWKQQTIARGVMIVALRSATFLGGKGDPEADTYRSVATSIVGSIFAAWGMVIAGLKFATSSSKNPLILSQAIMSLVPNLVNPIKLTGTAEELYPFIAPVADVFFNLAAGGLLAASAILDMEGKNEELQHFVYVPVVSKL